MKVKTILSIAVIIFCLFTARGVFAENEKEASRADRDAAVKAEVTGVTHAGLLSGDSVAPVRLTDLSIAHSPAGPVHHLIGPSYETFKILSLMEKKVTDKQLLKKISEKLPELSRDRLKMLASLSEEIDAGNRSAKTDFAFLVLTTLIIFS